MSDNLSKSEFGQRLYRLMIERGWSQSELARQADLPPDSISTYINGRSLPEPMSLQKLADALGLEPEEVLPNRLRSKKPDTELRRDPNNPRMAWLRINRSVPYSTGVKILGLLDDDGG